MDWVPVVHWELVKVEGNRSKQNKVPLVSVHFSGR